MFDKYIAYIPWYFRYAKIKMTNFCIAIHNTQLQKLSSSQFPQYLVSILAEMKMNVFYTLYRCVVAVCIFVDFSKICIPIKLSGNYYGSDSRHFIKFTGYCFIASYIIFLGFINFMDFFCQPV